MARGLAAVWPEQADLLIERFWPGPLTLVMPKVPAIPEEVTADLPTVGLRMPAHLLALDLITAAGVPIAAPSANRFTELSATSAEHVRRSLGEDVDLILDGGSTPVGIESTVLSLATEKPMLLRPGMLSREDIESVIGPIGLGTTPAAGAHASPGMHSKHYSPRTPLYLLARAAPPAAGRGVILRRGGNMPDSPREFAAAPLRHAAPPR